MSWNYESLWNFKSTIQLVHRLMCKQLCKKDITLLLCEKDITLLLCEKDITLLLLENEY